MKFVVLLYVLYISPIGIKGEAHTNESEATLIAEEQCGKYIHKAVRPLLNYIDQLKVEIEDNNNKIDHKDKKISNIEGEINICARKLKTCQDRPIPNSCTHFGDNPGIHEIKPNNITINVPCDSGTAGPGWVVIQQRINGQEDFYRNWTTYRTGFGNFGGDFFLGLENIHHLTNAQPHELYIHMEDFDGNIQYVRYAEFAIAGEDDQYRLITLGRAEGNATHYALTYHKNHKFSTYDRDNDDKSSGNCASRTQCAGGWWYNDCAHSNLNGIYYDQKVYRYNAIFWESNASLKMVKILLRPKNDVE
ncbi:microfibril-associated glycoprotein 4 [Drosophila virilis]|uniref:Fibrinogen C-terminal domain-containing protein n=1 Tax=Drosophila virilis TaxID=7244 RepID=B4M4Y7_DROVI|nr:microfibril-associated glycoprotein 4 [Drosophila virilis]EDW59698.2 uncharacterized protein Dvir_GJ10141 [Drosophila virilis]